MTHLEKSLQRAVWLTWFPHRRTESICSEWGVPIETYSGGGRRGVTRRVAQIWATFWRLVRADEHIVFVQNPSLGLTVVACVVKRIRKFRLVVDAHNEGVRPFNRRGWFIRLLTDWLLRTPEFTIVTNEALAEDVRSAGGCPIVLPDPLPNLGVPIDSVGANVAPSGPYVFVVATFALDEPINEIIEAARQLDSVTSFVFSGDYRKANQCILREKPRNVVFPGFLREEDFVRLMAEAVCVVDLTLKSDCLVCGAYEALSLGQPAILSYSEAARYLFSEGFEFVDNSANGITDAILRIVQDRGEYRRAVLRAAHRYKGIWIQRSHMACDAIWGPGSLVS